MPRPRITVDDLCCYTVARTLFTPTTLSKAINKLGFVQADPIRAPARAQDLTLRHRVKNYCAGDLERRYAALGIEEDFFVNYGFLPRSTQAVLAFVQERSQGGDAVHPREVNAHFAQGRERNWFGGTSNASTQLLDGMHFRGLLRIAGRASGVRTYAVAEHLPQTTSDPTQAMGAMDQLVDVIVHKYAPLPERSLREPIGMLRGGAPQREALRAAVFVRTKERLWPTSCLAWKTSYYQINSTPRIA